jgi:hypothetical protein
MERLKNLSELFKGFSKLNLSQRIQKIFEAGAINDDDFKFLKTGGLKDTQLGEKFIENTIGYFQLPIGVATQFSIDGKDLFIPIPCQVGPVRSEARQGHAEKIGKISPVLNRGERRRPHVADGEWAVIRVPVLV